MSKINVLVMTDIDPAMKDEIARVNPERINMIDASKVWSVAVPARKAILNK